MNDELSKQKIAAVLKALNDAIENGHWDESNFFKVIGKNLREIRDEFASQVNAPGFEKSKTPVQFANRIALRSGQQELFVALYSTEGANLQSWERIIANLPKQIISRPIYADEHDIQSIIKTKDNKTNEAYVSIYVNKDDVLAISADKAPIDKLGKPMLSLKDRSINLQNINFFIHQSGTYRYSHGRLIKRLATDME